MARLIVLSQPFRPWSWPAAASLRHFGGPPAAGLAIVADRRSAPAALRAETDSYLRTAPPRGLRSRQGNRIGIVKRA